MSRSVRPRPALFRALGRHEPPAEIEVAGQLCRRIEIFKHDSWAATARYQGPGLDLVCKFNRVQSILGLPMQWLGRRLAEREARALRRLADVVGIPAELGPVSVQGRRLPNAVAHAFIAGRPFGVHDRPADDFFPRLRAILDAVHHGDIAYVDLHKRENIVVGEDGGPHLVDFQVCFGLWRPGAQRNSLLRSLLRAFQRADHYHLAKHIRLHRPDQLHLIPDAVRPWWIQAHRFFAVPLRGCRRWLLSALGIRARGGMASSEAFPEDAVRRQLESAA
jgi:hypothetical protein